MSAAGQQKVLRGHHRLKVELKTLAWMV